MVIGKFKKNYVFIAALVACGLLFGGSSVFTGIVDKEPYLPDILSGSLFSFIIIALGIIGIIYNFKPSLVIEGKHIKGKFGWFQKIDADISDIKFVTLGYKSVVITGNNNKNYYVPELENTSEIYNALLKRISFETDETPEQLKDRIQKIKKQNTICVFITVFLVAMMFANIFIAVFFTNGKEMSDFNRDDWIVMAIMGVFELFTVFMCFYAATRPAATMADGRLYALCIRKSIIEKMPLEEGYVIGVYATPDYCDRITIFGSPDEEEVFFIIENVTHDFQFISQDFSDLFENTEELPFEFDTLVDITNIFK